MASRSRAAPIGRSTPGARPRRRRSPDRDGRRGRRPGRGGPDRRSTTPTTSRRRTRGSPPRSPSSARRSARASDCDHWSVAANSRYAACDRARRRRRVVRSAVLALWSALAGIARRDDGTDFGPQVRAMFRVAACGSDDAIPERFSAKHDRRALQGDGGRLRVVQARRGPTRRRRSSPSCGRRTCRPPWSIRSAAAICRRRSRCTPTRPS